MRRPGLVIGLALLSLAIARGRSCGPFFSETIFVAHQPPSHSSVMEGPLGLLWPDIHHIDLMLFYRRLSGPQFTSAEIAQVKSAEDQREASQTPEAYQHPTPPPGLDAWVHASSAPATDNPPGLDHPVPGSQWQTYPNCLDDAFLTAARTLRERRASYGNDQASLAEWIAGQDAVFSNCGAAGQTPSVLPSSRPAWLRQDRAYQIAAAHFYRSEWVPATDGFRAIANDKASPWHELAPYLIGRTLLRKAALDEPVAPVPSATNAPATAPPAPAPTFEPHTLAQAEAQLQDVAAAHTRYSASAQALVDFIQLRLDPNQAAARLALAVTNGKGQNLNQTLTDLDYLLDNPDPKQPISPANDLVEWIETTQRNVPGYPKHALDRWRQTHSVAWLSTALLLTDSSPTTHPDPELLAAAKALPESSPAWVTVTYNRLRLEPDNAVARAELSRLLPILTRQQSLSTANAFRELLTHRAATPSAFLALAATKPVGTNWDDSDYVEQFPADPHPSYFAGLPVNGNDPAFTPYTALILNQQLPLDALVSLVREKTLPRQLQFQLVLAVWTRAVLLHRDELAHTLTPEMIAGEPGWSQWLTAYDNATEPADRRAAALLALMRFPSVRPYVNAGGARSLGFVGYSEYRDNWWCAGMGQDLNDNSDNAFADGYNYTHSFSGPAASSPPLMPARYLPDFITPSLTQEARREQLALLKIGDAPAYFGRETLTWVRAHPNDPRSPELLGFAYRAMRNGCNLEQSNGLRLEIFNLLHSRYPQSTWAHQFKTYDPHADR